MLNLVRFLMSPAVHPGEIEYRQCHTKNYLTIRHKFEFKISHEFIINVDSYADLHDFMRKNHIDPKTSNENIYFVTDEHLTMLLLQVTNVSKTFG